MSGADVSYHQVITNPWLAYNNTIKLGRQVGCTQYTAREVMDCLLTRSTQDLVEGARDMLVSTWNLRFEPNDKLSFLSDRIQPLCIFAICGSQLHSRRSDFNAAAKTSQQSRSLFDWNLPPGWNRNFT